MKQMGMAGVELLFLVFICSLLSVHILPRLQLLKQIDVEYETICLVWNLREIQQKSMYMGWNDHRFPKDGFDPSMLIRFHAHYYSVTMRGPSIDEYPLREGVFMAANRPSLEFLMDGQVLNPLTIRIYNDRAIRRIIVDRVGRIRVERGG